MLTLNLWYNSPSFNHENLFLPFDGDHFSGKSRTPFSEHSRNPTKRGQERRERKKRDKRRICKCVQRLKRQRCDANSAETVGSRIANNAPRHRNSRARGPYSRRINLQIIRNLPGPGNRRAILPGGIFDRAIERFSPAVPPHTPFRDFRALTGVRRIKYSLREKTITYVIMIRADGKPGVSGGRMNFSFLSSPRFITREFSAPNRVLLDESVNETIRTDQLRRPRGERC